MSEMQRERDLVLNPNEYAYVLDKTKGLISCVVGSYKMSLSTSDSLVVFNEKTKRFEEASFSDAITVFVSAPENWYITLKNPTKDDKHPAPGTSNPLPELQIGKKVNIRGNVSFALYPGQMAKAIQGHRLHSNQYLLARVYDADALEKDKESDIPADRKKYTIGQLLVIKGTEVPFYIPPTGIEVIPVDGQKDLYIRDAVTLERLEYCILKDEQGNKKYIHGAAVVFPEPDEVFVENPRGGYKFKAIELSDISGIYVKVIADYTEDGKQYKAGDELFITGKDQMIYYPRPEHAIIDYEGQVVHHAIAIPVGEGRYVLDRKTGNIKTIKGAAMYLPDPRYEVVVRRKLTANQCKLWYPGNLEVYEYNVGNVEATAAGAAKKELLRGICPSTSANVLYNGFLGQENAVVEEGGFSRGSTYSKPRTITIDNKYDGVVSIDIWTGYAINVVSKNGSRKVVMGAQTYLMDYDETLEVLEFSTDRPKSSKQTVKTVYLRIDNNKVGDIIHVKTKDFVDVKIELSYCIDFLPEYKDRWFAVENYVKYITDRQRSLMKNEAKLHTIEDFYENAADIIRRVALNLSNEVSEADEGFYEKNPSYQENSLSKENFYNEKNSLSEKRFSDEKNSLSGERFFDEENSLSEESFSDKRNSLSGRRGRLFKENGMLVHDVEIINIEVEENIARMIDSHQQRIIEKSLELSSADKEMTTIMHLAQADKEKADIEYGMKAYRLELDNRFAKEQMKWQEETRRREETAQLAYYTAKQELQGLLDSIQKSELERQKARTEAELDQKQKLDNLEIVKQAAYTDAVKKIMESIAPDLAASLTSSANAELLTAISESMSPYAIADGESIAEVTNKLLRGTSLEGLLERLKPKKEKL